MRSGTRALFILLLTFLLHAPTVKSRPFAGRIGLGSDRVHAGIERDELATRQLDLHSKKPTKRFDAGAALSNSSLLRRADDEHVVSKALKWISNKSGFGSAGKSDTSQNEHNVESQLGSGPDATTSPLQRLHISDPVIVALPAHRYGPHATEHSLSQEARPLMGYDGIPVGHPVKIRTSGMSMDQRLDHWRSKYASGRVNFGGNVNVARPPPLESQAIHVQHPEYRWTNNYYADHMTRADHDVIFRRPQDFHPSQLSPEKFKSVAENGFLRDEVFMNRMGDGYAWDWYKHYHGVSSAPSSPTAHTPLIQPQRPVLRHEGSILHDPNQVSRRDADSNETLVRRAEDENLGMKVLNWIREKANHSKATSSDHAALSPSSSGVSSPHTMPTSPMSEKAGPSLSRTGDEHNSMPSAVASTQRLQITDPAVVAWPDHRIPDHMLARPRPDVVPYLHFQSSNWPNLRPRLGPHAPGNARSRAQVLDELTWHYQNMPRERLRELGIIPLALPIRDSRGRDGIPIGKPITFQSRGISVAHQRAVWKARSGSGRNAARNPGSPLQPRHRQSGVHYTDDFHSDYQYCNGPACHVTVFRRPPGFHPSQLTPAEFKTVAEHGFLENSSFVNRMGDADHWKALQRVHGVSTERVHPTRSENHYYFGHIDRRGLGEDVGVLVKLKEKHGKTLKSLSLSKTEGSRGESHQKLGSSSADRLQTKGSQQLADTSAAHSAPTTSAVSPVSSQPDQKNVLRPPTRLTYDSSDGKAEFPERYRTGSPITREQLERAAERKARLKASELRASRLALEGRMGASKDHAPAAKARTPDFAVDAVQSEKEASDVHDAAKKVQPDAAPLRMPGPTIVALPPEARTPLGMSGSHIPQVSSATRPVSHLRVVTDRLGGEASSSRASRASSLRAASGEGHDDAAAAKPDNRRNLEALRIVGHPHPVNVVGRPVIIHERMLSPNSQQALLYHQGPPPKPDGVRLEVSHQPATGRVVLFGRPPNFNPQTLSPNSRKVMKDSGLEWDSRIAPYKPPYSH